MSNGDLDLVPRPGLSEGPLDGPQLISQLLGQVAAPGDVVWSFAPVEDRVLYLHPAEAGPGRPGALRTAEAASWRAAVHPTDRERFAAALQQAFAVGQAELIYRRVGADGALRWLHDRMHRVGGSEGGVRIVGFARDVTACKQAEAEAELMQAIVATVSEGVAVGDERGRCVVFNPQMEAITGYTQADAEAPGVFTRLFPERTLRAQAVRSLLRARRGVDLVNQEWRIVRKDGECRDVLVSTRVLGGDAGHLLLAVRDITGTRRNDEQRRAVERRLREAERLESLGVMAGGIAHDFNNLLQTIVGFTDLAVGGVEPGSPSASALAQVQAAGQRATELTRQMLAYAGRTRLVPRRCDLAQVARQTRPLLAASLAPGHRLELEVPGDLPAVEADPAQLRQVLVNLVTNADEALAERTGRVVVRAGVVRCDAQELGRCYPDDGLPAGLYGYLEVEDDGCGMDETTRARLFDPFFSTKFTGRGLGLAAVLGIVRGHHGTIMVRSQPQVGTVMRVLLPLAPG